MSTKRNLPMEKTQHHPQAINYIEKDLVKTIRKVMFSPLIAMMMMAVPECLRWGAFSNTCAFMDLSCNPITTSTRHAQSSPLEDRSNSSFLRHWIFRFRHSQILCPPTCPSLETPKSGYNLNSNTQKVPNTICNFAPRREDHPTNMCSTRFHNLDKLDLCQQLRLYKCRHMWLI